MIATRELILRAALTEMAEAAAVDMASIADRAGLDRSTLYRYFGSRERLLRELSDRSIHDIGEGLSDARLEDDPFELALQRFMRAIFDVGDRYVVLVREHVAPDEHLLEELVRAPLRRLLQRGLDQGRVRGDLDPGWLFVVLWRLIGPSLDYSVAASDPDGAAFGLVELFLHGAGASAERPGQTPSDAT